MSTNFVRSNHQTHKPHVVIVGAGFAGLHAAKQLRKEPVSVTVVDRNNYHRFQPLLYQVATAGLEPGDVAHNVRDIFQDADNIRFRRGIVREVAIEQKCLVLEDGPSISYDYLVLAAGTVTNFFGVDGAYENAFPLKELSDAIKLRNHIIQLFEGLDSKSDIAYEGILNFVIVGGGPTGVEMAGALVELFDVMQRDYKELDTTQARVYLLEMLPSVLPPYAEKLQNYTRRTLEDRGVKVMTDETVTSIEKTRVVLEGGHSIPTQTLIWAAGVRPGPVVDTLDVDQERGGRIAVASDLSLAEYPECFVVGDMSGGRNKDGDLYPQLAPVAIQQGKHAAAQTLRKIKGKRTNSFNYRDAGKMATIGRHAAVAEWANGLTLKGYFAWIIWVVIHIAKLVGFRNRLVVLTSWAYNYFTYDRSARLLVESTSTVEEMES